MAVRRRAEGRRPLFSVVTIVRNEAPRLPRLLESLAPLRARGGEVVVLDTGSDDGTAELAKAAGCRVFVEPGRFDWRLTKAQARRIERAFARGGEGPLVQAGVRLFDFGRARAWAAGLAGCDYQLAVDGADVVDALDIDALNAIVRAAESPILHFETRMLSPEGWMLEARGYFHDRRRARWSGRSHNFVQARAKEASGKPVLLPRDHLRVSHHTTLEKAREILPGTALEMLAHPDSIRWTYFLARALAARGHARSGLEVALRLDRPQVAPPLRSAGLCMAALCRARSGASEDEVEGFLLRAALRDSSRRDPLIRLATRRMALGDMQGAASFAAAALSIPPRTGVSEAEENHGTRPHAILYWALLWLGRREEARAHFEACRRLDPSNPLFASHARLFGPPPPFEAART
ncbi:MAG: glycosyltransferase [Vicinamibacteria bacterium]|nr:glycosyltransferase [Vicinamibacteria bacterium]